MSAPPITLSQEIERLRAQQLECPGPVPARDQNSEASLRQRLQALLDDDRRLRAENSELRQELAIAHGQERARRAGAGV